MPSIAPSLLIVESNQEDSGSVVRALMQSGHDDTHVLARTASEALDYLLARGDHRGRDVRLQPKAVLVNLPEASASLELLRTLREQPATRLVPAVILASSFSERELAAAYAAGANSCLQRPSGTKELAEAVRRAGNYWSQLNVPVPVGAR
ncbi:MAG TPA: hypothetical protein VF168_09520 [Trueperaceae bacterium]